MPLNGLVDHLTTSNLSQRKIFLLLLGIDIAAYPVLYLTLGRTSPESKFNFLPRCLFSGLRERVLG